MNVRLALDPWAPEFGSALDTDAALLAPTDGAVNVAIEVPAQRWAPRTPPAPAQPPTVAFVDGVRRIEARVWLTADDGSTSLGVCASWAAGVVRCDGAATVERCEVERALFASVAAPDLVTSTTRYPHRVVAADDTDALVQSVQERMRELEGTVAAEAGDTDLLVLDGPLRGRQALPNAVGYVKTHRVAYLPPTVADTVPALAAGQRTPLFVTQTTWSRYSWYLRLPGASDAHPWAGVVRCEASADLPVGDAVELADRVSATLPRFASSPHRDARAPQNLHPIGGLERQLKHRLGDAQVLYRQLRAAVSRR